MLALGLDPECAAAYEAASALLEQLGHVVEDVPAPFDPSLVPFFQVLWAVSAAGVPVGPGQEELLRPLTRWLREQGRATPAPRFTGAVTVLQLASRRAVTATVAYDAVLTPTLARLPAEVGWFQQAAHPAEEFARMVAYTPFTATYNSTGQPAVSLPLHWTPDGLPVGVQLVGRPADEATLLRLSAQLEQARPWRDRHPQLW
jgi:amidase